jgi:hypothetical protein
LWATNLPYEVIPKITDPDTGLVVQPETGVRAKCRRWPEKKAGVPLTPEQERWVEYVNDITMTCTDPTETIKLGFKNTHAYNDINVVNLCKTAHPALASILIDRCELGASQTLHKLGHENIHLANDALTRANTANKEVTDEQLIIKLQMGNPYNRKGFYNKPQQGMQPWESVQGWFDKIDLLVSEIKEVSRIADTAIPTQISDSALCRMLSKHLTPVYKDIIHVMQLTASVQTDVVLNYALSIQRCMHYEI